MTFCVLYIVSGFGYDGFGKESESMDLIEIGNCLRELRKENDLTQAQIAERFGVSPKTVSRWENGIHMPDLEILLELADFYEVDLRALLRGERVSGKMPSETKETLHEAAGYSKAQYQSAHKIDPVLAAVFLAAGAMLLLPVVLLYRTSMGNPDNAYWLFWHLFPIVLTLPLLMKSKLWSAVALGGLTGVSGVKLILRMIAGSVQGIDIAHLAATVFLLILAAAALQHRCVRFRKKLWFVPALPYFLIGVASIATTDFRLGSAPDVLYWLSVRLPEYLLPFTPVLYGIGFLFAGRWFAKE